VPFWFFVRRTVSELRGVKFPQFAHFGLFFSDTKRLKVAFVRGLKARSYIAECSVLFRVVIN